VLVTASARVALRLPADASYGRFDDVRTLSDDGATLVGQVTPMDGAGQVRALVVQRL